MLILIVLKLFNLKIKVSSKNIFTVSFVIYKVSACCNSLPFLYIHNIPIYLYLFKKKFILEHYIRKLKES